MMKGPKVTVIGAGSYFFGKPVIHKMATSPIMAGGTLALQHQALDTHELTALAAVTGDALVLRQPCSPTLFATISATRTHA